MKWLVVVFASVCFFLSGCEAMLDSDRTYDYEDYAYRVLDLVNEERSKEDLEPLEYSVELSRAAMIRAKEITVYFDHTRPDGSDTFSVVENIESYANLGENLAKGQETPEEVVEGWMNSPGHRENIMNEEFTQMGFGYYYREEDDMDFWVQIFGRPDE